MNVKPLILAAALGLALNAHAAPKAASKGKPVKTQKAAKQAAAATHAQSGAGRPAAGCRRAHLSFRQSFHLGLAA